MVSRQRQRVSLPYWNHNQIYLVSLTNEINTQEYIMDNLIDLKNKSDAAYSIYIECAGKLSNLTTTTYCNYVDAWDKYSDAYETYCAAKGLVDKREVDE